MTSLGLSQGNGCSLLLTKSLGVSCDLAVAEDDGMALPLVSLAGHLKIYKPHKEQGWPMQPK